MSPDADLLTPLRRYWGYDSFPPAAGAHRAQPARRPRYLRGHAHGRRQVALLPIAGGSSPEQTVVVISPLIALMQDQVAQLAQMGIPAAVLNSSLSRRSEQSQVMRQARAGEYRLLYLSPERLARDDTLDWLQRVPVCIFRHRRGALHFRMGTRVPAGLSPVEPLRGIISRSAHRGVHRQRHAACASRHYRAARTARSGQVHCQLPPAQSALPGARMRTRASRLRCC